MFTAVGITNDKKDSIGSADMTVEEHIFIVLQADIN